MFMGAHMIGVLLREQIWNIEAECDGLASMIYSVLILSKLLYI